jgi:type IV pilus assembly protein PilN
MAKINLLPWRVERRKQREREFYMMLLGAGVAALAALLLAIGWMDHLIGDQTDRNTYFQQQIKTLDKQIEEIQELDKTRSALLTRKEIIEQLQSNRSQMVHLFDEMVRTIPDGVRLTSMKQATRSPSKASPNPIRASPPTCATSMARPGWAARTCARSRTRAAARTPTRRCRTSSRST